MTDLQRRSQVDARAFIELSDFLWHQRFELLPGVSTPGNHDIGVLFELGGVPGDLQGKTVLDIGTSNGGAAFLMERWGAERVVAVDIYPANRFGFDEIHRFLGSAVEYVQGTVYELSRLLRAQTFDYVLFWGVLYHLRHPLLALDEVRSVLAPGGTVDIESAVADDEVGSDARLPVARFYRRDELAADPSNWFSPTVACLQDWCLSSGFELERVEEWGDGPGKRCMIVARRSAADPEFRQVSYEVPLEVAPRHDASADLCRGEPNRARRAVNLTFAERFRPPERPWTHEYVDLHRHLVSEVLDDAAMLQRFGGSEPLPAGYGIGLDERIVEFPWLFAQGLGRRVLDAGSALNHEHILDRLLPLVHELHIVTLEPEELASTERRVSYLYADLRDLPYRDGFFDTVVCLSTLEHVGMDNTLYGVSQPRAADPVGEMRSAVAELVRVTSERLLLTVPYGRREDHGWLRQFDRSDIEALLEAAGGRTSTTVFRYSAEGWQVSDLQSAASMAYRDFTADPSPVDDLAAAARAVACISIDRR